MKRFSLPFEQIVRYGKLGSFLLLIVLCVFLLANNWSDEYYAQIPAWYVLLPSAFILISENAVKFWAVSKFSHKIAFYVADFLLLLALTVFSDGTLISLLYITILSEFYLSQEDLGGSIAFGAACVALFLASFALNRFLNGNTVNVVSLATSMVGDLILLVLHFFVINFSLQIYRKNREIVQTVDELAETNEKLMQANAELKEIAVLEERQRIAKDIHDTAGHSITTVIMQTEAAKLLVDADPAEAKRRIASANLQAKHALEELRESVHLLSGMHEEQSLREVLLGIIHESTDGTGITVRYEIADVSVCGAKRRFFRNLLKEGISNGLRHGKATAFWCELKEENGEIGFVLSDNGEGAQEFTEGFGLSGMRSRAEALGGTVTFSSEPGEGFEIDVTLPSDPKGD